MLPIVLNTSKLLLLVFVILNIRSNSLARVGETREEVEVRYGPPIPSTHPMLNHEGIRKLLSMPDESGIAASTQYVGALADLINSPYNAQVCQIMSQPYQEYSNDKKSILRNNAKYLSELLGRFHPIIYLNKDILIQVVYFDGFSISEQYFTLVEEKGQRFESGSKKEAVTNKMSEWFRLGDFSYRINAAKVSKTAVSANDFENQIASALSEMVLSNLKEESAASNLNLNLPNQNVRFVIIEYDIRNEAKSPSLVLTDDFRIEDNTGRQFSPDGELTKKLIETSDKSLIVEVLQPGIERSCRQGFRLPANALNGQLYLNIPQKGMVSSGKSRVIIKEGADPSSYSITPIDSNLLRAILGKTLEKKQLPVALKWIVTKAESGYYDYINEKWGTQFSSEMALNFNDGQDMSRVFLNFLGTGDHKKLEKDQWVSDPLYKVANGIGWMNLSQSAKKIREALKQAEETAVKVKNSSKDF